LGRTTGGGGKKTIVLSHRGSDPLYKALRVFEKCIGCNPEKRGMVCIVVVFLVLGRTVIYGVYGPDHEN
jgi:hypothetical protein